MPEMSKPVFWKKNMGNISKCRLLKILPIVLSVMVCSVVIKTEMFSKCSIYFDENSIRINYRLH